MLVVLSEECLVRPAVCWDFIDVQELALTDLVLLLGVDSKPLGQELISHLKTLSLDKNRQYTQYDSSATGQVG